ncbi:unnamed protein product, partial [Ectocarpus sp. 8 AP-2014]
MRNLVLHTLAILGLGVMPLGRCNGFSAISSVLKLSNPPSMIMLGKASTIQGVPRCRRQRGGGLPGCEGSSFFPSRSFPYPPVAAQDSTPRRCTARMCLGSHNARAAAGSLGTAAAAAVLRGGAMEHNVIAGVLGELANIRTPAALLGGAALGTMFIQPKADANRRLHLLYT